MDWDAINAATIKDLKAEVERLRMSAACAQMSAEICREELATLLKACSRDVDGSCRQCRGTGEVTIWLGGSVSTQGLVPCGLCDGRGSTSSEPGSR
jgi:hypothetical protein